MKQRAFTVVELLVVIVIMSILLILAVVNVRSTQINARDNERQTDAENLALSFETFYNSGLKSYPATNDISIANLKIITPSLDPKNYQAPGNNSSGQINLVPATNALEDVTQINPKPGKGNDVYVYQPIDSSGALCINRTTQKCRRFNIYTWKEVDGEAALQKIESKVR